MKKNVTTATKSSTTPPSSSNCPPSLHFTNCSSMMTLWANTTTHQPGHCFNAKKRYRKRVCAFEESVELYGFNLKLRRYLHDETSIETDLSDQDSGDSMNDNTSFNQDDFVSSLYDTKNIDESI
eukprot:scaffold29919_cov70-Cyclotella_meneghiniana.AAC.3